MEDLESTDFYDEISSYYVVFNGANEKAVIIGNYNSITDKAELLYKTPNAEEAEAFMEMINERYTFTDIETGKIKQYLETKKTRQTYTDVDGNMYSWKWRDGAWIGCKSSLQEFEY